MNIYCEKIINELKNQNFINAICYRDINNLNNCYFINIVIEENMNYEFYKLIDRIMIESIDLIYWEKVNDNEYYFKFDDNSSLRLYINFSRYVLVDSDQIIYNKSISDEFLTKEVGKISREVIGNTLNHIFYLIDNFNNSMIVKDKIKAMLILNEIMENIIIYLNYSVNNNKIISNYRECVKTFPALKKEFILKIYEKLKMGTLIECVKMIFVLIDECITEITIDVAFIVNIDYYLQLKRSLYIN